MRSAERAFSVMDDFPAGHTKGLAGLAGLAGFATLTSGSAIDTVTAYEKTFVSVDSGYIAQEQEGRMKAQ